MEKEAEVLIILFIKNDFDQNILMRRFAQSMDEVEAIEATRANVIPGISLDVEFDRQTADFIHNL